MLKHLTLAFVGVCILGGVYEFTLRDKNVFGSKRVLRIAAEGWQVEEFKLHQQVARFAREHPDVEVELHVLPSGYETGLMLQASLKDLAYDLILSANNYNIDRYYLRGLIIPPTQAGWRLDEQAYWPGLFRGARLWVQPRREAYLIPYMGEVNGLNYRKDLFARAGLSRPPETWAEFEEYAERLNHIDPEVYAISLNCEQGGFFLQNVYTMLLRSLRGQEVDEAGHLDLSSPESREVFRMLKRWWRKGLVNPACRNPSGGAADEFKAGRSAMYPMWQSRGLWAMRNENLADKIGIAPMPEAKRVGSLCCLYGGFILKGSASQDLAVAFMTEAMCGYAQPDIIAAGKMPVTVASYRPGVVPDWMIEIGNTLRNGYMAPEPITFTEQAESVSVAFQNYLDSPDEDPDPYLRWARDEVDKRVHSRRMKD